MAAVLGANASIYYVSSSGTDTNSGLSIPAAWRSPARANSQTLAPGDQVLFEGGTTFTGSVIVASPDTSSAANPIVFASYGTGRATINGGTANGFYATNRAGIVVSNLNFAGSGRLTSTGNGIYFVNGGGTPNLLDYARVDHVDVSGFNRGIFFYGNTTTNGFRDVRVTNADVHDNARSGIETYALARLHTNFYVGWCRVWNNTGVAGAANHTGDGIVLGNINTALIEHCVSWTNGWIGDASVGIWCWDANRVTMQFCESHHNGTSGSKDGGGFDIDGGSTDCVAQYNYSHDNTGAGIGIYQYVGAAPFSNNIVRFNISQNDGRKNDYSPITLWNGGSGVDNVDIYNNTIYVASAPSSTPRAVYFMTSVSNVRFRNNCFITTNGLQMVYAANSQPGVLFQGNNYWPSGGAFSVKWGTKTRASLAAWRSSDGQEMIGTTNVGFNLDPQLVSPGGGGTLGDTTLLPILTAYQLKPWSPLCEAGLDLLALFGLAPGPQDFFANPVPNGLAQDIGAQDAQLVVPLTSPQIESGYFTASYQRGSPARVGLDYQSQVSGDFVNWCTNCAVPVLTNVLGDGSELVKLRGTTPASGSPGQFMRMSVRRR